MIGVNRSKDQKVLVVITRLSLSLQRSDLEVIHDFLQGMGKCNWDVHNYIEGNRDGIFI